MKPNPKRLKTRLAVRHQRAIRNAVRASVDVQQILESWFSTHPEGTGNITPNEARMWARVHTIVNTETLRNALYNVYADSVVLGRDLSTYQVARTAGLKKAAPTKEELQRSLGTNWSTWTPGNRAAALQIGRAHV